MRRTKLSGAAVAAVHKTRFRIGVHLGDVIEKADGTVYGDGVNIAARLQALAEPGGITVSDAVRGAVRGKVAASFDDQGEQPVKNIAASGACVRACTPTAQRRHAAHRRPAVGQIDLSLPDKPSIAVLPFVNMSGDPEQDYFTDGITEDIITDAVALAVAVRDRAQLDVRLQGPGASTSSSVGKRTRRALRAATRSQPPATRCFNSGNTLPTFALT